MPRPDSLNAEKARRAANRADRPGDDCRAEPGRTVIEVDHGRCEGNAVTFTWDGNDEMEPATGHGWAEILDDGSLEGAICPECGDDIPFIAR